MNDIQLPLSIHLIAKVEDNGRIEFTNFVFNRLNTCFICCGETSIVNTQKFHAICCGNFQYLCMRVLDFYSYFSSCLRHLFSFDSLLSSDILLLRPLKQKSTRTCLKEEQKLPTFKRHGTITDKSN